MGSVNIDASALYSDVWDRWARTGGPALEEAARDEVGVDTRELQASISFRRTGPRSGELRATATHAVVHHEGHGEIRPKSPDGVLTWLDKFSGNRVFAKVVGPVKANPYLINAARRLGLRIR